jgi:Histidine kinase-, DNA gyrase B-, and HSP90-like ATPase
VQTNLVISVDPEAWKLRILRTDRNSHAVTPVGSTISNMPAERVRLRIGNLAKAVLVSGQAYQDPKDALNEFVSNAADEYVEAGHRGQRIRVVLRRKGRYPVVGVDDSGRGMSPERLREVARSLFESSKVGDDRTLGEKAIGILAFQQLGGHCDVVSRTAESPETWVLHLHRGKATATLERERRRARQEPGTTVYLSDLDPEVLRVLTQRRVVEYLRARRGAALANGDYEIEVVEGRSSEMVLPQKPDGVRLAVPPRQTLWGRIEFALYVAPADGRRRRVSVVGRAGTSILDDLAELEEFAGPPWDSDQVSGRVVFASLQQTAGRRAILRDRAAFPLFVDAIKAIEPAVAHTIERVAREVDAQTADRLSDVIRRIFGRVLKELEDLDNPMRSAGGPIPGPGAGHQEQPAAIDEPTERGEAEQPGLGQLLPPPSDPVSPGRDPQTERVGRSGGNRLPTILPDPEQSDARSRFDPDEGVVYFNDAHADYLMVKDSEPLLLDYLATLVAKEYVVYNNPRADPADIAEELVRMLVRVRRHIPKRSS